MIIEKMNSILLMIMSAKTAIIAKDAQNMIINMITFQCEVNFKSVMKHF